MIPLLITSHSTTNYLAHLGSTNTDMKKHVDDFLKELLRLEGRCNHADQNQCQGYHILSAQKD